MPDILLDAPFFDDLRAARPGARALVAAILNGEVAAAVSPLTVFRVWQDPSLDRRAEIGFLSVLRFVEEAPLTIDAAKSAAIAAAAAPNPPDHPDLDADDTAPPAATRAEDAYRALIAATAAQLGVPICAPSPEPFARFGAETAAYEDIVPHA